MIYHRFREDARIVHLHGPKPNHYLEWLRTGSCSFGDMCSLVRRRCGLAGLAAPWQAGLCGPAQQAAPQRARQPACTRPCWPHLHILLPSPRALVQGIYGGGFCKYASEYRHFVPEWQVVHKVHRLCSNLAAGTWHPPV